MSGYGAMRAIGMKLHWWIGISAGAVLAIMGSTGALLAFEDEVIAWLNPPAHEAQAGAEPLEPPALLARVREQLPEHDVVALRVAAQGYEPASLTLLAPAAPPAEAAAGAAEQRPAARPRVRRLADPWSGELLAESSAGGRGRGFFQGVERVHRYLASDLFGQREIGRSIVGACAMLMVVMLLTGLVLRLPKRWRGARYWLTLDGARGGRVLLFRLHAVAGTWLVLVYLLPALTGPQWSFQWYRRAMYAVAGVELPAPQQQDRPADAPRFAAELEPAWRSFAEATRGEGFQWANFELPQAADGAVQVRYLPADPAHNRATSTLWFEPASGELQRARRYAELPLGEKLTSSVFAVHTGAFFGMPGRLAVFLAALGLPFFFVTGFLLHRGRTAAARRSAQRRRQSSRAADAERELGAADERSRGVAAATGVEPASAL